MTEGGENVQEQEPNEFQQFDEWMGAHSRGTLNDEATAELANVVQAVTDIGKKGVLIVELVVERAGQDGRTVAIGGRVRSKMPQPAPELSIYFPDHEGRLHRDDPYQSRFRVDRDDVDKATGEILEAEKGENS